MSRPFRESVCGCGSDEADADEYNTTAQLRFLFAHLMLTDQFAVTTEPVTNSFGWLDKDVHKQQDVQEFFQILVSRLRAEGKAQDSSSAQVGAFVRDSMTGMSVDYKRCTVCAVERCGKQPFVDLQLHVRGMGSLRESLLRYLASEQLEGINCDTCAAKTRTVKGFRFESWPAMLSIQLSRFEMNYETMQREKVLDALALPPVLDAAPYLPALDPQEGQECPQEPQDTKYELYGMLMHSGGAHGGHYYSYIKHFADGQWYLFNDANVTALSAEEQVGVCV